MMISTLDSTKTHGKTLLVCKTMFKQALTYRPNSKSNTQTSAKATQLL